MFGKRMKTVAIPERVYALCCALSKKSLEKAELKNAIEPEVYRSGSTSYFSDVYEAALELGLIMELETKVSLNTDMIGIKDLQNLNCFRKKIMPVVVNKKESLFYKVTKAYLNANEEVFVYGGCSNMVGIMQEKINEQLSIIKDDMRAWRFWVSFLGICILHDDSILIPNMYKQLVDVLTLISYKEDVDYTARDFLAMLQPYCSFAIDFSKEDKQLNLGLSSGLRMLHDMGKIEIKYELDTKDVWHLYNMEEHRTLQYNYFSHIRVREKRA